MRHLNVLLQLVLIPKFLLAKFTLRAGRMHALNVRLKREFRAEFLKAKFTPRELRRLPVKPHVPI